MKKVRVIKYSIIRDFVIPEGLKETEWKKYEFVNIRFFEFEYS